MCHAFRRMSTRSIDSEEAAGGRIRGFVEHAQRSGAIVLVCLVIWLATGAGYFWPGWVLLGVGLKLGMHARHMFDSSDRTDREEAPADVWV